MRDYLRHGQAVRTRGRRFRGTVESESQRINLTEEGTGKLVLTSGPPIPPVVAQTLAGEWVDAVPTLEPLGAYEPLWLIGVGDQEGVWLLHLRVSRKLWVTDNPDGGVRVWWRLRGQPRTALLWRGDTLLADVTTAQGNVADARGDADSVYRITADEPTGPAALTVASTSRTEVTSAVPSSAPRSDLRDVARHAVRHMAGVLTRTHPEAATYTVAP